MITSRSPHEVSVKSRAYYQYLRLITKLRLYKIVPPFSFLGKVMTLRTVPTANRYRNAMKFVKRGTVCEIGSNGLSPLAHLRDETVTIDIKYTPGVMIVASAAQLPFTNAAFDTVVALDVIEHLPRFTRDLAIEEMIRVARDRVILSTPLEDGKEFLGRQFDLRLNEWFIKKYGRGNPPTSEHLVNVEPSPDDLSLYGFRIIPSNNAKLYFNCQRLRHMLPSSLPLLPFALFITHLYYMVNAHKDNHPPFWGGTCVLDKTG